MRQPLSLDQVELDLIAQALGGQDWPGGYLDPATGAVHLPFQGEVYVVDEGDEGRDDWVAIAPEGSHEAYQDMADFAEHVDDRTVRRDLDRALEGRGAFRRFRGVMYDAPEELGRAWNDFRHARAELRALRWLERQDLLMAAEIEERSLLLTAAARESLPRRTEHRSSVVDIAEKLSLFSEHWSPKVVARLNDYEIKLVKVKGEFVWHAHEDTDELFLVIEGSLTIQLRDGDVTLRAGQLYVVPRGVEHCPVAEGEVAAMLIEPAGVLNTGDADPAAAGDRTAAHDDSLLDR